MKPGEALSKDARALLCAARGGDDISSAERQRVLLAFQARAALDEASASAPRLPAARASRRQRRVLPRPGRRFVWALAAVISTGSLAALAHEGAFAGWGAAIERVLDGLTGKASPASAVQAVKDPAALAAPPAVAAKPALESMEPEASLRAGEEAHPAAEAVRAPDESAPAEEAPRAAEAPVSADRAERATEPAVMERHPGNDMETKRSTRAPRAQKPAAPSHEPAQELIHEPSLSGAGAAAPEPSASDELDLIVMARNALARGRHADARNAAELHALQFPRGLFSEERDAVLALADCRDTGDSARARAFVTRRPDSLFAERIRRDCKLASNLVPGAPGAGTHQESPPRSGER